MRDIKFRVWDKEDRKMAIVHQINWENGTITINASWHNFRDIEKYKLMQYTGFKDRNGEEIYEGDIVETEVMMFIERVVVRKTRLYIVGRDSEDPHLWLKGEDYGYEGEELISPDDIAVVGNIYENSELLQGIDDSATDVHSNSNY